MFSLIAETSPIRSHIESMPLFRLTEWWSAILVVSGLIILAVYIVWITLSDRAKQPVAAIASICLFRLAAVAVIFIAFLNLQQRREKIEIQPSRVAVIIDSSLSMSLPNSAAGSATRFQIAKQVLLNEAPWKQVVQGHEVRFFELDSESTLIEIGRLNRMDRASDNPASDLLTSDTSALGSYGWWLLALSMVSFAMTLVFRRRNRIFAVLILSATLTCIISSLLLTIFYVNSNAFRFLNSQESAFASDLEHEGPASTNKPFQEEFEAVIGRVTKLESAAPESRIASSLKLLCAETGSDALAGIILLSDGVDTSGEMLTTVSSTANAKGISIVPIGFGTTSLTDNLTLFDLMAPKKVYKGNPFSISGKLRMTSSAPAATVKIVLTSTSPGTGINQAQEPTYEAEKIVTLGTSETASFEFEFMDRPVGQMTYTVSVEKLESEIDINDNQASVSVEIVDKQARILLFAGGPSREFRFLRNQLFRDPNIELHVLLQSADLGADQESDKLLTQFPDNEAEFNRFDCLVAFDPDWSTLTPGQAEMTRRWVANESGGLIVIAGPVNTPIWTGRPKDDPVSSPIRKLYPVSFYNQTSGSILLGRFGGVEPFSLSFTKAASSFDFLRFAADDEQNHKLWNDVKVYGYYAVNEEKAGAEIIAHFSDPLTSFGGKFPIYLAAHLYGNGRVYFQASGELWRTRGVGPEFFETYYTRLIHWTSQGRLLRGDDPITLSVDKETCLVGDFVNIRATLQQQNSELENANKLVVSMSLPDSIESTGLQNIELTRIVNETDKISFGGRVMVKRQGRHRLQLATGGLSESKLIKTEFNGKITDKELKKTSRNDSEMQDLANQTNGKYFDGKEFSANPARINELTELFSDHSIESISSLSNDLDFQRRLQFCLLICFTLFMTTGWIIRRLNRLA